MSFSVGSSVAALRDRSELHAQEVEDRADRFACSIAVIDDVERVRRTRLVHQREGQVTRERAIERMVPNAVEALGGLDVLVKRS